MASTSPQPTWRVVEWDGPSEGPITFMVEGMNGETHVVTSPDGLTYNFANLNGRTPSMQTRVAIGQVIVMYAFRRAFLKEDK